MIHLLHRHTPLQLPLLQVLAPYPATRRTRTVGVVGRCAAVCATTCYRLVSVLRGIIAHRTYKLLYSIIERLGLLACTSTTMGIMYAASLFPLLFKYIVRQKREHSQSLTI
ncbi:hypothetical protein EDB86DRAFT_2364376 [Lactarius hatsudake]|nr:hypothetical protein EDB86DRAFT_2364376 [Lactarius hatsudake]